ncbi:hypothetical protein BC829DRAFT_441087 [Chytridium lagenaria]|nr:hypothetical protein BC829DRAFT_441087 [Chytridium lagenaria]
MTHLTLSHHPVLLPSRCHLSRQSSDDDNHMDEDEWFTSYPMRNTPLPPTAQGRLEPATSEQCKDKGKEPLPEYEKSFFVQRPPTLLYEELVGPDRDQPSVDVKMVVLISYPGHRAVHPLLILVPIDLNPPLPTTSDPNPEKLPGSNRYNVDLVLKLVNRLKDLGVDVTVNDQRLRGNVTYRNEKIASFTSLVTSRRERLYSLMSGARDMLVESSKEIAQLTSTEALNIRRLDAESAYSDAALATVRKDLTSSSMESQMRLNRLRNQLPHSASFSAPPLRWFLCPRGPVALRSAPLPATLQKKVPVRLPPNHPLNHVEKRKNHLRSFSVDSESLTDTTTASAALSVVSSASASRRKHLATFLRTLELMVSGLTKAHAGVEKITKKLTSSNTTSVAQAPLVLSYPSSHAIEKAGSTAVKKAASVMVKPIQTLTMSLTLL